MSTGQLRTTSVFSQIFFFPIPCLHYRLGKKRLTDMYSWLKRNLSSRTKTQNPKSPSPSEEEEEQFHGITSQLVELVQSFSVDTFKNFPLPDDNQNGEATRTSGGVQVDLSEWQQRHAILVLSKVKELSHLRYLLCPRHLKERQFWTIYFALVKIHILEYELQAIRLEKLRKMALEDEKSSDSNGIELEMSDTKQRNNSLKEDGISTQCEVD